MNNRIVHSSNPVTLIGGGEGRLADVTNALELAPTCVAIDGGAALALKAGANIAAVIGDFDSIRPEERAQIPEDRQHPIADQDSTDFEKALIHTDAPAYIGVGLLGGRLDHHLAAAHTLMAFPHRPCVLLAGDEVMFLAPPEIKVPTQPGDVVSLFPLGQVTGVSNGLHWPIGGLDFRPGHRIGTSNFAEGPMRLRMQAPAMLLILGRKHLPSVMQHFAERSHARWPAPT